MSFTSIRVDTELRDVINKLCHTSLGKVTPNEYLRKILGLDNEQWDESRDILHGRDDD